MDEPKAKVKGGNYGTVEDNLQDVEPFLAAAI